MIIRRILTASSLAACTMAALVACGSEPTSSTTRSNAMQVVAGDEDKVAPDGTVTLTSKELQLCKNEITQAGRVHENMTAMAASGESGEGWASYTAGLPGWLSKLSISAQQATTPQFSAALDSIVAGGQAAVAKVTAGTAPEATDYDPAAIAAGLTQAAAVCESAGVNISWHA